MKGLELFNHPKNPRASYFPLTDELNDPSPLYSEASIPLDAASACSLSSLFAFSGQVTLWPYCTSSLTSLPSGGMACSEVQLHCDGTGALTFIKSISGAGVCLFTTCAHSDFHTVQNWKE